MGQWSSRAISRICAQDKGRSNDPAAPRSEATLRYCVSFNSTRSSCPMTKGKTITVLATDQAAQYPMPDGSGQLPAYLCLREELFGQQLAGVVDVYGY